MNLEPETIRLAREALEAEGYQVETHLALLEAGGVMAAWHPRRGEGVILSPTEVRLVAHYGREYIRSGLVGMAKKKAPGTGYGDIARRYFEAALSRIVNEFHAEAAPGNRNNALNKAAYSLGRFVGAGVISEAEAREIVLELGLGVGLPKSEVEATGQSGLRAGQRNPVDTHKLEWSKPEKGRRFPWSQ